MPTIHIQENFLSHDECDTLINLIETNYSDTFNYESNKTTPLPLIHHIDAVKFLDSRLLNLINSIRKSNYYISNSEVVKWHPGISEMSLHYDFHYDIWSAIIYLNDDYFGGKTIFENGIQVKPKKGSLVLFTGSKIKHGVTKVLNGDRYTVAYWIRDNEHV